MQRKIKILYFVDVLVRGGIQSFIVDFLTNLDRDKIQVDVLTLDDGVSYEIEKKLKEQGFHVYKLNGIWIHTPFDFLRQAKALDNFFKNHPGYDIAHLHSSSKNFLFLQQAKKHHITVRISHAHSNKFQSPRKRDSFIGNILKWPLRNLSTDYFACSDIAGKWLFGKRVLSDRKFKIVPNAIEMSKFVFDKEKRDAVRKELNLGNCLVIGNIGRLVEVKNHLFLLDIFKEVCMKISDSFLILVGDGEFRPNIEKRARELGVFDKVRFLGFREDRNVILNAMDVFVCPSYFEGFGIVLVEAQTNGLMSYATDGSIPKSVKLTELLEFVSLDESAKTWASKIINTNLERKDYYKEIELAGFNIVTAAKDLENFYLDAVNR